MTLGSLFDGIAGFPLAAERQGIKTVWISEIEANCIEIAKRHFPDAENLGDITEIDGGSIPAVDIISFGSPCQDLSVAGGQKGLDGARSGLFMEAVRIVREMRKKTNGEYPKYIIWENVAGAFSSNKGEDFRRVLEEITESNIPMPKSGKWANAGMVGIERAGGAVQCTAWRMLDAQFWGVPQRRKRIYLVNDFGNGRAGQILFECESVLGYHSQGGAEEQGNSGNSENSLTGTDCRGMAEDADGQMKLDFGRTADRIYINAKTSVTLMSQHRPAVVYGYTQSGYGEFKEGVGTLKKSRGAAGGGSETLAVIMERIAAAVKYRVRRLTPLECERLDGFPDEWTRYGASGKEMSDNARYMALGNSIAVPCAERVFIGIKKAESEE